MCELGEQIYAYADESSQMQKEDGSHEEMAITVSGQEDKAKGPHLSLTKLHCKYNKLLECAESILKPEVKRP